MNTSEYCNEPHARWEKVELSSCFELQNGINFSSDQRGKGLLVLDVLNMFSDDLYVRTDQLYRVDIKVAEDRLLCPGDILFVRSSVKESGVGWPAIFKGHDEPVTNCGFLIRARQTSPKLEPRFLVHYLRQNSVRAQMISRAGKVAITNINQERLGSLKIPLPPLEEQKRIADILDRAEALRAKRRAALAQLDELVHSIFIDMFGDPIINTKEWEICSIGALLTDVTNGLTRRRKESDEGTDIVLRLRDIREGWIDFSDVNRISLSHQESSRYKVSVNDLLFIRVNGNPDYVGRCALFEGFSEPVYFNDHIMRVKTDQSKVDGKFLVYMLNGTRGKREIALHRKTSAGQHTINQDGLSKIEIPLPPLKIQKEFAFRTASIEKLKTVHRASLAELDDLFASLQHRAFRGEL